jgi:hypothetical protein
MSNDILKANDVVTKLQDLLKQATTERSHYYVASCCGEAISEIKALRQALSDVSAKLNTVRAHVDAVLYPNAGFSK